MNDSVKHPEHYNNGPTHSSCGEPIECIDVIQDMSYNLGTSVKYIWRAGKKDPEKFVEDLRKAIWCCELEILRHERAQEDVRKEDSAKAEDASICLHPTRAYQG